MSFCSRWTFGNATPSNFPAPKSWVSDLSFEVLFVSVLATVLSEYWKMLENFFSKWYYFRNFLKLISFQKKNSSSFFQYSERNITSTETNDTSKERSDTQLFGAEKFKGRGIIRRAPRPLFAKGHWKKSKFDRGKSGCKKIKNKLCQYYSYIMRKVYAHCFWNTTMFTFRLP